MTINETNDKRDLVSLVFPIFNEQEVLPTLFQELRKFQQAFPTQVVFVDDGSKDLSGEMLKNCSLENVTVVILARNYGHQAALSTGLRYVNGKFVVTLDADLQHPIELIPEMIKILSSENVEVVQTFQRVRTHGSVVKKLTSYLFWTLISKFSPVLPIRNSGDFRAMKREFVHRINAEPEPRVLRFLIPRLTSNINYLEYQANQRFAGKTKFSLRKMISLALSSYLSLSVNPLRIISLVAIFIASLSLVSIAFGIYAWVFYSVQPGWTSLFSVTLFLGACNLASIAIIGQYILRIYEKVNLKTIVQIKDVFEIQSSI